MDLEEDRQDFYFAARYGDVDALEKLFADDPTLDVNHVFRAESNTALHLAVRFGHSQAVEYLISKGADLHLTDYVGRNAAHEACGSLMKNEAAALSVLQILFEKDCTLLNSQTLANKIESIYGQTCLHLATFWSKVSVVAWLLDKGADTTIKTNERSTAWDEAVDRLTSLAFLPDSRGPEKTVDSFCVFLQREVRLSNYPSHYRYVWLRKIRELELYRLHRLSRISIFALLEHLSQRNVFEQSCQQIRREVCRFISTSNGRRCREPSCIFETHSHDYHGENNTEADGVGKDQFYINFKDIPPSDLASPSEIHAAEDPQSIGASVDSDAPSLQPNDQSALHSAKIRNPRSNYVSVVMPILSSQPKFEVEFQRSGRREQAKNLFKNLQFCRSDKKDEIEFHGALTLDEYSYPVLPEDVLDRRNNDQTLMRLHGSWRHYGYDEELIMVDQAWIWQAQDVLIFTNLENLGELQDHLDTLPILSHADALLTGYGQIGVYLADLLDSNDSDAILDIFQTSIVKLVEEVGDYSKQTGVESIGIDEEKRFYHEINDIREELSMIRRVFSQQEEVWRDFTSNAWPEIYTGPPGGQTNHQSTDAPSDVEKQDQREIAKLIERPRIRLQKRQRRIAQLDEDAERVERSIGIQLDLKKQHTSLQEAHATAIISAAAFGFAVITIIFTPLSFAMSLFALPIDRFQDNQIPSRWDGSGGMYTTNYIGTWTATTEIVSVALTLAATWLAIEYGLKYRITRQTWDFLKDTPGSLKPALTSLKHVLTHRLLHLRSMPEKEKDEENKGHTETRTSMGRSTSTRSRVSVASRASRASRRTRES